MIKIKKEILTALFIRAMRFEELQIETSASNNVEVQNAIRELIDEEKVNKRYIGGTYYYTLNN